MAAMEKDKEMLLFNKEEFYAARRNLTFTELSIWCYLAEGNEYNKKEIARLNGITERTVERAFNTFKDKGYYINNVFIPISNKKKVIPAVEQSNLNTVIDTSKKENIKVENNSQEELIQKHWIGQF